MKMILKRIFFIIILLFTIVFQFPATAKEDTAMLRKEKPPENAIWVDSLDISKMICGCGTAQAGKSVMGNFLSIGNTVFRHGIGTHADSYMGIDLKGAAAKFISQVGVNDDRQGGSVIFEVWVDEKRAAVSPLMKTGDKPYFISADLNGAQKMYLIVDSAGDGNNNDHADWAGAMIFLKPGTTTAPDTIGISDNLSYPIAHGDPPEPKINGPGIVGTTPGHPFLFLIPATGEGPLTFDAKNLPESLTLDPKNGIISGTLKTKGEYIVELIVQGARGTTKRKLKIVGGKHKLALTPPMGWNSWNVWGCSVDDQKVRSAIDWMVKSGLASHGYQYVNIDDCWEGGRADNGEIKTNEKFPDMKALTDYAHSKGLKLGIYSSPGPRTCAGYEGTYKHEYQDARTWAKWGIDYIKYDWCSYGRYTSDNSLEELKQPYELMRKALDKSGRDIVFSLCQYGMGNVWEWGKEVGGNLWRTTGDITDNWGSMSGIGFGQAGHEKYAGPGHWNDPDMLVVGKVGWGPNLHPTNLKPNEQVTHITLWSMLAAPLLIGCDMSDMEQLTIDLLTNDEVLEVNQDPRGEQASRVAQEGYTEVWKRPLFDGTIAVAMFNKFFEDGQITVKWSDLKLKGEQPVRDLWQQKDLGTFNDEFTATVPVHSAIFLKIGTSKQED